MTPGATPTLRSTIHQSAGRMHEGSPQQGRREASHARTETEARTVLRRGANLPLCFRTGHSGCRSTSLGTRCCGYRAWTPVAAPDRAAAPGDARIAYQDRARQAPEPGGCAPPHLLAPASPVARATKDDSLCVKMSVDRERGGNRLWPRARGSRRGGSRGGPSRSPLSDRGG